MERTSYMFLIASGARHEIRELRPLVHVLHQFTLAVSLAGLSFLFPASASAQSAVTIYPGDDIQTALNNNPEGTTFVITPGEYRLSTGLVPKSNDILTGQPGAVLNGSKLVTAFAPDGSDWVANGVVEPNPVRAGVCFPASYAGCKYAEAVFYDDQPLWRVTSREELGLGKFYIDYLTNSIYLADDPDGHKIEVAVSTRALKGWRTGAQNVTVQGLVIEKFANEYQRCALEADASWIVKNNEVRLNHGVGICDGARVTGNYVHHNGQMGMGGGGGSTGMLVENNEIAFNNIAGFNPDIEAGGTKWLQTSYLTIRGNYVHDNKGPGLWTDTDNIYTTYENNYTRANQGAGIFHEVSFDAVIRNNTVEDEKMNPAGDSTLWWGGGILVAASSNVEVYGNTVINCINGIGGVQGDRGSSSDGRPYRVQNLTVHDNLITQTSGTAAGIVSVTVSSFTAWNNHFSRNHYRLADLSGKYFHWMMLERTKEEWQSFGNDIDGTFSPPPPPGDFGLALSPGSQTVKAGTTANYTLILAPSVGFNGTAFLSCSGAPPGAGCSISPSSLTLDGSSLSAAAVTVTTTTQSTAPPGLHQLRITPPYVNARGRPPWILCWLTLVAAASLAAAGRKSQAKMIAPLMAVVLLLFLWTACGGGVAAPVAPVHNPKNYTITVTGTSGQLTHGVTATLTVR